MAVPAVPAAHDTISAFTATFAERFERAERDGELSPPAPDAHALIATAALNTRRRLD